MIPAHYLFSCPAGRRLHLGVSGSVAAYKSLDLLRAFTSIGLEVDVSLTSGARQFLTPLLFQSLGANVYAGMFAPDADPFGHLRPGQTAAAMLVCPATANILTKMAHGFGLDLLDIKVFSYKVIYVCIAHSTRHAVDFNCQFFHSSSAFPYKW